jgi:hypothetical protein
MDGPDAGRDSGAGAVQPEPDRAGKIAARRERFEITITYGKITINDT